MCIRSHSIGLFPFGACKCWGLLVPFSDGSLGQPHLVRLVESAEAPMFKPRVLQL